MDSQKSTENLNITDVQPIQLFNSIVARLALHIPLLAKGIVENALKKLGTTPLTATPRQIKKALNEYIYPQLRTITGASQQMEIMGGGVVRTDGKNRIFSISKSVYAYINFNSRVLENESSLFEKLHRNGLISSLDDFSDATGDFITRIIHLYQPQRSVLEITCALMRDENKNPDCVTSFIRDITLSECLIEEISVLYDKLENSNKSLKERSEELTKAEAKFRTLSMSLPVGVMLLEENNEVLFVNTAWDMIFDFINTRTSITNWTDFIYTEDREKVAKKIREARENQVPADIEFRITTPKTPVRWVNLHSSPLAQKKSVQTIFILKNIDERIKIEENLKQTQVQLMQSDKMASIGQLAAGVAHELNNPIGFVTSNFDTISKYLNRIIEMMCLCGSGADAQMIAQKKKNLKMDVIFQDLPDLLKENQEGLVRIQSIISNLREFSRIDDKTNLSMADLNKCIENSLTIARNEIKYHSDVKTEFGEIDLVSCRAGEINQVFLNILVNAAQAIGTLNRENRGLITIKTWQDECSVFCTIADNGPGIPPEIITKVFDPFFTTKDVGKGTGLGLSISYDIIKNKHNGEISVTSEAGNGTVFLIKLPRISQGN